MIRLENIHKSFKSKNKTLYALRGVNLTIDEGKISGIIGRSGAGKSTLIRMVNLLERPDEGQVLIDNQDITSLNSKQLSQLRHNIGMVFQHFNLLTSRTVIDNVMYPLRLAGVDKGTRRERAAELLELVGLSEHSHKYPRQLSGGQQQRVGIARALANRPSILLCDEATSALDPETTQSVLALLKKINQEMGITIVLITHSMDVIRRICDEVAIIDEGVIVEHGNVIDVFLHPQHKTTKSLLSESGVDSEAWRVFAESVQGAVIRLTFQGDTAAQPLFSQVSRELNVNLSVLQGTVGKIKETRFGQLVVGIEPALSSDEEVATEAEIKRFFEQNNVVFEVLRS